MTPREAIEILVHEVELTIDLDDELLEAVNLVKSFFLEGNQCS